MPVALTHTVTHTGKRADGTHGTKSFRPHPFWGKNARKALYANGRRAFYHLVRMRSAVRIRPAAPKSIENFGFRCFFVVKTHFQVWGKMRVNRLTHTLTHTRKTYQEPAEPPGGSVALRPVALFLRFDTFYCFQQRKICANLRCPLVSAGLIELHCKSSRNVLSSSRKYTREILHFLRERDFLCARFNAGAVLMLCWPFHCWLRLQRRSLFLPTGTT